jgi:hypothetical protein
MSKEFKPTHRYLGGDTYVNPFILKEGMLVERFEDAYEVESRMNGRFRTEGGEVQVVFDDCMEAI